MKCFADSQVSTSYLSHKETWLRESASPYLTPLEIRWITERKNLSALAKSFDKRGFVIEVHPDKTERLMLKGKEIARFRWSPI